ncbi:hypothetical protein FXF53_16915 [Micromonospora sp. WP24]|nr:hypothetical protein FXF53_16915 [Micromonospora sp. WP24]
MGRPRGPGSGQGPRGQGPRGQGPRGQGRQGQGPRPRQVSSWPHDSGTPDRHKGSGVPCAPLWRRNDPPSVATNHIPLSARRCSSPSGVRTKVSRSSVPHHVCRICGNQTAVINHRSSRRHPARLSRGRRRSSSITHTTRRGVR